jgi:hypothetical protein
MAGKKWNSTEISLITKNYQNLPKDKLQLLLPDRSWDAIKLKANQLELIRELNEQIESDLSSLLGDNILTYYWIGFLMTDGYINHRSLRLKFELSKKDKEQVILFAEFIKCKNHTYTENNSYCVMAQNKLIIPQIIKKYDFNQAKTYHPPDLNKYLKGDLLIAFLIGFIDGDGSIKKQPKGRKDCCISIKMHSSWLKTLQFLSDEIHKQCNLRPTVAYLNKEGYAVLNLANSILLRLLKEKTLEWNLPVLFRKWDLIDKDFYGRIEIGKKRRIEIHKLYGEGIRAKEIATKLGISKSRVSVVLKELKIKEVV